MPPLPWRVAVAEQRVRYHRTLIQQDGAQAPPDDVRYSQFLISGFNSSAQAVRRAASGLPCSAPMRRERG